MQGTYKDIHTLEESLTKLGLELVDLRDPNHRGPDQPPTTHPGHSGSHVQDAMHAWVAQHPNDAVGTVEIKVLGRSAPMSGWVDPGDSSASGQAIKDYIAAGKK